MSNPAPTKRSPYWDNIKGLLMFLTVFAHILYQLQTQSEVINQIVDIIYLFHMPAFVFISGYFGKSERSRSFPAIAKLLFLYFIFNSMIGFLYGFNSLLEPVYSYWYLIALMVWRLTARRIAKFREINLILYIVALFAGFYESIDNTFAVARIISFYPYYMAGFLLSPEQSETLTDKNYLKRFAMGMGCLLIFAVLSFSAYQYFSYSDLALQMGAYSDPIDAFGRIVLYIVAFTAIYSLRCLSPDKNIPILTMMGRNSLCIFLLHRPLTLLISDYLLKSSDSIRILVSLVSALLICVIFGNDFVTGLLNRFTNQGAEILTKEKHSRFNFAQFSALVVALGFVVSVVMSAYGDVSINDLKKIMKGEFPDTEQIENDDSQTILYPIMTKQQEKQFEDAFRITFSGDLILLEDQVKRAYNGKGYDFSDVFEYSEKYISSADLAIGVFEGPMAGKEAGYSSSNFDDGKELYLNFPDEFAVAVKNAGFDLVTTANNHLLDRGAKGAERTLDILDKIGLAHTGSYRNLQEKQKEHIKLVECDGLKMAFLSYTYGSNNTNNELLTNGSLSYLTSIISGTEGEQFEQLKESVIQDFKDAKAFSPDLIIVLPHIGTQFSNEPDAEQETWFNIFKENGADIILGDHPHVVEPAMIEEYQGKHIFTAYCPGNFANIYRENQGDTSALIDVYIDRNSKQVIGGGIVPLYTQAPINGNYRALPIYDIMHDTSLMAQLSTDDMERASDANKIITNVIFGHEMDITSVSERYYFNENGFIRSKVRGLQLTEQMKSGTLYQALSKADSICFIGDSVTEGTKNGGCPWYEPIEEYLDGKQIENFSKGGCTVSYMLNHLNEIPAVQLYVIAIGTNDVRYRDEQICAMTAEEYISRIKSLKDSLKEKSPSAEFVFIAPWYSTDGDIFCPLSYAQKTSLNQEYSDALQTFCTNEKIGFVNPNPRIMNTLSISPDRKYFLDHIHPNICNGVLLLSESVLLNSVD